MKKIMFDDHFGLTNAVMEGRKTMTRRVVPECKALDILRLWERNEGAVATGYEEKTQSFRFDYCPDKKRRRSIDHLNLYPKYKVGEVVAIAQRYTDIEWRNNPYCEIPDLSFNGQLAKSKGWKNKMYVRPTLMPNRIRITSIKAERLQGISEEECLREGVYHEPIELEDHDGLSYYASGYAFNGSKMCYNSPRDAFAVLIDKISGKGTWEKNPWVFAYSFELIK